MRTAASAVLLSIGLFTACNTTTDQDPRMVQLEEDHARALDQVAEKDSLLNDLFGTMNRISDNLRTIRTKQGQLGTPSAGEGANMEQRIMDDITSIDALLAENRNLLDQLRKRSKASGARISELERTVQDVERSIAEKDEEVAMLKEQLSSTNSSLATLIEMYRDKSQLADMQRNDLNTAFYAVGTAKELKENGVLTKEGGVAGIGGVSKLNTQALPVKYFTRIDITSMTTIPVAAKKARLVTSHPDGSYRFEDGAQRLVITDPNAFWSISKYLVVQVD